MSFFQSFLSNKRAIIYSRVSTEDQAERGYSLNAQEEHLNAWCNRYNLTVVQHFQDDGASAKTFDRPQFNTLQHFVKANKNIADYLLVAKWDRFSRNMEEALTMIKKFRKIGIIVNAIDQWIDYEDPNHALMLAIHLATPQVENDVRSNRTTIGMRRAAKEGRWMAKPPKGYKLVPDGIGKSKLVPSDDAHFIQEAFQEVSERVPLEETRQKLLKKGFKISSSQFQRLIRNIVYLGKIKVPAYKEEKEQIVDGMHEAIIPEALFYKTQESLGKLRKTRIRKHIQQEIFVLRGFLVCSECDHPLTGSFSQNKNGIKYPYYHCQNNSHKNRFPSEYSNNTLSEYLQSITVSPNIAKLYQKVMSGIFQSDSKEKKAQAKKIEKKIKALEAKVVKIELKFADDEVNLETFNRIKGLYEEELRTIQREQAEINSIESNYEKYLSFGFSFLSQLGSCYLKASYEVKRKIVCSILGEKLIFDGINYRTPKPAPTISLISMFNKELQKEEKRKNCSMQQLFPFGTPKGPVFNEEVNDDLTAIYGLRNCFLLTHP